MQVAGFAEMQQEVQKAQAEARTALRKAQESSQALAAANNELGPLREACR